MGSARCSRAGRWKRKSRSELVRFKFVRDAAAQCSVALSARRSAENSTLTNSEPDFRSSYEANSDCAFRWRPLAHATSSANIGRSIERGENEGQSWSESNFAVHRSVRLIPRSMLCAPSARKSGSDWVRFEFTR